MALSVTHHKAAGILVWEEKREKSEKGLRNSWIFVSNDRGRDEDLLLPVGYRNMDSGE